MNCQTCNDPTKYIFSLWDGTNGTHGRTYDCRNIKCLTKQTKESVRVYREEEKRATIIENAKNGISMERVKMQRRELKITIMKMSQGLGISPSDYSNYEMCRVALPVEMSERIEGVFRDAKI